MGRENAAKSNRLHLDDVHPFVFALISLGHYADIGIWKIEMSYYEQKTFWAMRDYKLRGKTGMERLMNLLILVYSAMTLLPYAEQSFAQFKSCSAQETRFLLGNLIRKERLLSSFADSPEAFKKYPGLAICLRDLVRGLLCSA